MSWPRRSHGDEEIERVARALQAAAHGAPDSPGAGEIRARVLEGVSARGSRSRLLTPVMVAAVAVVLALIVAIGAPAVGSLVRDLARPPHPVVAPPSNPAVEPDDAEDLRVPMRTPGPTDEAPLATASPVPTTGDPSSEGGPPGGAPAGTVTPAPGGPPDPRPTGPPFPIPTPPVTGPPPGLP